MASLDAPRIIDAVVDAIEEEGPENITMRSLARRLEVTPTALYYWFDGKSALLDAAAAQTMASILATVDPEATWQERLAQLVLNGAAQARRRPRAYLWLVTSYFDLAPLGQLEEMIYQLLEEAGLPVSERNYVQGVFLRLVLGQLVIQTIPRQQMSDTEVEAFPHIVEVHRAHAVVDVDEVLERAVRDMIRTLEQR
jgi:AcrR family transcriptional regulator